MRVVSAGMSTRTRRPVTSASHVDHLFVGGPVESRGAHHALEVAASVGSISRLTGKRPT